MGTTLREVIFEIGGGIKGGKNLKLSRQVVLQADALLRNTLILQLTMTT